MAITHRHFAGILAAVILSLLSGCVPSLHPIYTEKDVLFDPALVGTWIDKKTKDADADYWRFERAEKGSYKLTISENKRPGVFEVRLLKIKDTLFLDLYPAPLDLDDKNDTYKGHLMPVHTFVHVLQIQPTFKAAAMDPTRVKNFLEQNPKDLKHEIVEESIVITASTAEIQAFVVAHLKDVFAMEPGEMTKK